jgi:penicillin-binding protein-related factor A (putative recombinase)
MNLRKRQFYELKSKNIKQQFQISSKKKRTIPYDELKQDDVQLTGRNHFRINTYLTIIDKLNNEL